MKKYMIPALLTLILLSLTLSACNTLVSVPMEKEDPAGQDSAVTEAPPADETATQETPSESSDTEATPAGGEDFVGELQEVEDAASETGKALKAADFSLRDHNGERHNFSDYEGKLVILNFWQTWCPPCRMEMPDFQKVYEKYGENKEDVVILGVASPRNEKQKEYSQEQLSDSEIKEFLEKDNYTYPSLMDYTGDMYNAYQISAFPTTFFIGPDGNLLGRIPGAVNEDTLVSLIDKMLTENQ